MKEVSKYIGGEAQADSSVTESRLSFKLPVANSSTPKLGTAPVKKKKREGC